MRAAGILGALDAAGRAVDRAGAGFLVEAYPAAALKCWGLPYKSYKGPNNRLALWGSALTTSTPTTTCS